MPHIVAFGLDAGSTTTKLVGVDREGRLAWHRLEAMDPRMEDQAERLLAEAAAETGTDLGGVPLVATGYGRELITRAGRKVTEITCHGKGVFAALGHGGTLVDIGGQDSKVIVIADTGRVIDFAMNDKCAAGTGRFLEVAASRLRMELPAFAQMAVDASDEESISNTCTVFAESEIVSLIARGRPLPGIARGLHRSLVKRIAALARSALVRPPVMLSGGGAKSPALRSLLGQELGHDVSVPNHPQLMGAYGAALIGRG
jgi:(R)-2-hydroxyacyl-CoA dehydratese activating ATPase